MADYNVHISRNSTDVKDCGSIYRPCKTLEFTIQHIISPTNNTVILHGGTEPPYYYYVNETINIPRDVNLTIQKSTDTQHQPIFASETSVQHKYAFQTHYNSSLSLSSITFANISVVNCTGCNITMVNCSYSHNETAVLSVDDL